MNRKVAWALGLMLACMFVLNAQNRKAYKVGESGPAGGMVFYDRGNANGEWRYLEVALADIGKFAWGDLQLAIGDTVPGLGMGKQNTDAIVKKGNANNAAALQCSAYSFGGFDDWYLPSKDELNELFKCGLLRNTFIKDSYWTSSENTSLKVWHQYFSGSDIGKQFDNLKHWKLNVRPIRRF